MSEQTAILQELVKNTRSMKRYMAVLTFFVLLVAIMPVADAFVASRQGEQEAATEVASSLDDGGPEPFVLEEEWTLGEQIDPFTENLELYTARSPQNAQGTYVSLYCSPRSPNIEASIWFADTPMFSDRDAEYQHLRAKPGFLTVGAYLMISTNNLRSYRVTSLVLDDFLAVRDSLVVEVNRTLGITETLYFVGIDAATSYLRKQCQ